ncbi:ceramidase domain-containing protein [Plantactinospora sp. KLBMP9567]|uniref:ceramidase domain-containing protein n=1 Tax=Plantactinospora sp. KLBMP9567 TaxID=3085900 RepID=UPI0029816D87|nr:ceramidase domain-containing protein [Plantactinospora sp. KLBMP9567]MDW5330239.1 ceramidase domain-containing protein [Plantactinospora sp. KLBMP9567]
MDYVDWYCERTGPGFWGEPFNAVSNVAFLVASAAVWLLLARGRARGERVPASVVVLAVEMALIGLGSGALHTTATEWGAEVDNWSIIVFIHTYVVCLAHWMWGVRWRYAWLAAPAYTGAASALLWAVETTAGETATVGGYLPAFVTLLGFAVAVGISRDPARRASARLMWLATGTLTIAITSRTIDQVEHERAWEHGAHVCDRIPGAGTHFLWHVFTAVTLLLITVALLRRARQVRDSGAAQGPGGQARVSASATG